MNGTKKTALLLALALVFSAIADSALAHGRYRSRAHIGLYFGVPLAGWGWYGAPYYSPYYYPPTSVVVVPQPQTYIQQDAPAAPAAPAQQGYWYYCADAQAYYPYVKECPAGWQRVTPQPPS